jgi:hypothetical protein
MTNSFYLFLQYHRQSQYYAFYKPPVRSQIRDQILPLLLSGTFDVSSMTARAGRAAA